METILGLLCVVVCQEQDPRKPIWSRLDLKHGRSVFDDNPPERVAPPPTQRGRVTRSDDDLFPLEAHGMTLVRGRMDDCVEGSACAPSMVSDCVITGTSHRHRIVPLPLATGSHEKCSCSLSAGSSETDSRLRSESVEARAG